MIERFLDAYELKARIAPGLIVALPMLAVIIYAAPVLSSWSIFAASGVCSLALLYGLGHVVRACGDAIESGLWESWGGPPSSRFMRQRDSTFGTDLKNSIHRALERTFCLQVLNSDDEARNSERADKAIADAFRRVRQYLRLHDPDGLWSKHNIEYGFCRNLLACRVMWVLIAISSAIFSVVHAAVTGGGVVNPALIVSCLSLVCALYVGWFILPKLTKRIGESYAEFAWMAFLELSERQAAEQATI